ncbi:hypothetical protein Barb4_00418 [Bacteroidales bacterium Barb4]|nr:hypothetical protein Barb4_00418 [Bacteroidales bacterium Barb4]
MQYVEEFLPLQSHSFTVKTNKMATPIRPIPVLKGKTAERFIKEANEAYKRKGTVDFSEHMENARKILATAKI